LVWRTPSDVCQFRDKHELKKIQEKRFLSAEWPDKQNIELLVQRAGSLFTYAATVCRFIGDSKFPKSALR
jgi:hypothetical protein